MTNDIDPDQSANEFLRIQALDYASKADSSVIYETQDFLARASAIEHYIRTGERGLDSDVNID